MYTLTYGSLSSVAVNPIEKKPLYHFHPGTFALTAGSWGCNFGCPWCQNWEISKVLPPARDPYTSPEAFVEKASQLGCQGTSVSLNEPTLSLEWSLEVFRLARPRALYNTIVTNGYMTPEALALLIEAGLDAMNVDVKGKLVAIRRYCQGIDAERIWRNLRAAVEAQVHLEVTTVVIPGVNDDVATLRETAERIVSLLGADIPWHVNGYFPAYRFQVPATPVAVLEQAWAIGKAAGLRFVYLGNVLGHAYANTPCPQCGMLLIERAGIVLVHSRLRDGQCPACGLAIPGVWDGV